MANTSAAEVDLTENHTAQLVTCVVIFCTLSTTAVVMRLWSKSIKTGIKVDDFFLVASQICVLAWNIMVSSAIAWAGMGYHQAALSEQQIRNFSKMIFASSFIQPTSLALAKISMLLLLNHLFPGPAFRWTVRILGGIVVAWWITLIVGEIFICWPINSHWDTTVTAHCGNQQAFLIGTPIPWIVTDIAILIAPIPVLKQLQLPTPQKWGLIGLFLVGILTCIVSIVRYTTLWYSMTDVSYDIIPAALWGVVETNITSFCAAIIACRPVLTILYPTRLIGSISDRFFSRQSGSRSSTKKSKEQISYPNMKESNGSSNKSIKVTSDIAVEHGRY